MQDEDKTKEQLIIELHELREQIAESGKDRAERKRAEEALAKSEKRFSVFMEHLPVGAFIKDQTGRLLFVNRYLEEFFGWRECVGKTNEELMLHGAAERMIADERRVLAEGPVVLQERITDILGAEHFFDTYRFPIMVEGSPALLGGITVDITDRKLAEAQATQLNALKEQLIGRGALNEKLGIITEAVVQIYDADFARIWITKEGDLCEKGCSHARVTEGLHVCRDRSRCLHLVAGSGRYTHLDGNHRRVPLGAYKIGNIASGKDASFLTNDVIHDSSVHNHEWAETLGLVSFAGFRLISPDGNPIGVLALFKKQQIAPEEMRFLEDLANTTSQVIRAGMAEEALRENENRFRSLVLNSSDTITVIAADGTIRYQSPSLKRFFGYEPEDLIGKNAFPYVHPDDLATAQAAFTQILEHPGKSVPLEYRFRHANGSWIFVESIGSNFLDDPSIKGVVLNSRDISERKRAEEALRESQQMLQSVLDAIPVRVFWKNLDSNYLGCNRPFALDAGLQSPEEIIGRNDFEMGWAEQAEFYRSDDRLVMETGRPKLGYEESLIMPDGGRIWRLANKVPLRDTGGRIKGVLGTYEDITNSKQMEDMLRASETRYRIVADNTYDWEYWMSPQGKFLYTSPSCERITGYAANEFETDPELLSRIVHPDDLAQFEAHVKQDQTAGRAKRLEFRIIHRDGMTRWIAQLCQPVLDTQGRFLGIRGSNRDSTARKQAEEAVRAASRYARSLIEASLDPLVTISPDGKITDVNSATETVTGYDRMHLIGTDFSDYFTEPAQAKAGYQAVFREGSVRDYPLEIQHRDGHTTSVLYNASVYRDEKGQIVGAFAAARDITERERAERALQDASEKLKFFAYSVAHDLKSPAVGIYGLTKRLRKHAGDVLDEKGRTYCDQIMKVSEHIAALVEKVNIFIATKEAVPFIESTNITEILRMLRDEFSPQLSLRRIEWLTPESEVKIKADRLSILRIFRNLIDNALKYGGESLTRISIGYEDSNNHHIFSVSDNGKGLKDADSEKIFGLFQRDETARGVEGAGLGLTIVKEIAEQHGGRVWVEPRGKSGITFYVSISKSL
ncbi:MAG: PAS domain S-box protein [Syntrophobacteraceae bacterium]